MRKLSGGQRGGLAAVLFAYLLSVMAAVQLGRFAPAAKTIMDDLSIDLRAFGWVVSLINAAPAALGVIAGFAVVRYGLKRSLCHGAVGLAVLVIATAATSNLALLLVLRLLEGFAYLLIVIAAPTVIALSARPAARTTMLALWGSYFFIGLSLSAVIGGWSAELLGWRTWLLICGFGLLAAAAGAQICVPRDADTAPLAGAKPAESGLPIAFWCLATAFFGIALLSASIPATLPAFLIGSLGFSQTAAGLTTGLVALASLAGNVCYGVFSRWLPDRFFVIVTNLCLLAVAVPIYGLGAEQPLIVIASCALAFLVLGMLAAQAFAAVPKLVVDAGGIGVANGLLAQLGSVGALAGAPLFSWIASAWGWQSVPSVLIASAAVQLLLLLAAFGRRSAAGVSQRCHL